MRLLSGTLFWLVVISIRANHSQLGELIQRIHQEIDTSTVLLLDVADEYLNQIVTNNSNIPVEIFKNFPNFSNNLKSIERNVILVVQVDKVRNENRQYLDFIETVIVRLRDRKFVIVIGSSTTAMEDYFPYFGEHKFTRIFGIAEHIPFVYLPYADCSVQELSKTGPIPNAMRNLNGYSIRTTVQTEFPRVFWYTGKNGQRTIGGAMGQLFLSFLQKHNATFTEIFINNSSKLNIPGVINATSNGDIDISMNTYSPVEGLDLSYPVKYLRWAVMLPLNGFVESSQYFLRPFTLTVWIFIGLTLVYIVVMDVLKDFYANIPIDLWSSIKQTFLTLLALPSGKQVTRAYRFHAQVLLLAFILSNLYLIYLTSFLTVFIKIKQYSTVEDLIENKVPLMMIDYEWDSISDPELHVPGLEDILVLVDSGVFIRERDAMNTSYAYAVGTDKAEFLLNLQMNTGKPLFHVLEYSLLDYYLGFLLINHSPFREILDKCVLEITESGLVKKWQQETVVLGPKVGLVNVTSRPEKSLAPLTLNHLRFAWTCLIIGLTVALVVFFGEYMCGKLQTYFCQLCGHS